MKVGQYVKARGAYGTVQGRSVISDALSSTAAACIPPGATGVGEIDGIQVVDVLLAGDAEPTEFLPHEIEVCRVPKSAKGRSLFVKKSNSVAARPEGGLGKRSRVGFVPVPQAGIFTPEDLRELDARYEHSRLVFNRGERQKVVPSESNRETISNTTRYWQTPGTGTIYGGRL